MNARKLAAALRLVAEALEEDIPDAPEPAPSRPRKRQRDIVRPAGEPDELAKARAAKLLSSHAFVPRGNR